MTKREMFTEIANLLADREDIVEFCNHEIELLARKRATGSSKPTKQQVANEATKSAILDILSDEGMTATEVMNALNMDGMSIQRVSALLRQLVLGGQVNKVTEKKVSRFTIA